MLLWPYTCEFDPNLADCCCERFCYHSLAEVLFELLCKRLKFAQASADSSRRSRKARNGNIFPTRDLARDAHVTARNVAGNQENLARAQKEKRTDPPEEGTQE